MKLSEFKKAINQVSEARFILPDGRQVPRHYHVTEVGVIQKHFVDCGGTIRNEQTISLQLYTASDYDHRLDTKKLTSIIEISENKLSINDSQIEVEYQGRTIEKYSVDFKDGVFFLVPKETACLASDKCGITLEESRVQLQDISSTTAKCTSGSGCC